MQLSEFKTYVKRDFKRTDKDTEIVQAYNDMLNWLTILMPNSNYKFQSYVNTSVGVEDYALPVNIIHLLHPIRLLDGSASSDNGYPLQHLTKEEYDYYEPNPNRTNPQTSKPWGYTVWSRSILLTGIPDLSTYLIEINWSKRRTVLSEDTDLPSLGSEYDEILKWGTLERLYAGLSQFDEASYWGSKYHDQEDNPIGVLKRLLDIEMDSEGSWISRVKTNCL